MGEIGAVQIAALSIIGLVAGGLGGLLGVGGSVVMIPAMTILLGPAQHLYQAAAMIVNFFVVVPAVIEHGKAGAVMKSVIVWMAPVAVAAVLIGVWTSEFRVFRGGGQRYLMALFGGFLLFTAARGILRMFKKSIATLSATENEALPEVAPWKLALYAGLPTGFLGGLLGVGGGVVAVPVQNRLLNVPLRNAIANSSATIVGLSLIGAIGKNYALAVNHPNIALSSSLTLAAILVPSAFIGSMVGSKLTHRLPLKIVSAVFTLFLLSAGIRMTLAAFGE